MKWGPFLAKLLSWRGRPVMERIDPTPIWREAREDEIFQPGRTFRMNMETGKSEVLVDPSDRF